MFENNPETSDKSLDFGDAQLDSPLKPIQSDNREQWDKEEKEKSEGVGQARSRKTDSAVTDEKLFMESTGFGEPKHHTEDFINS